MTDEEYIKELEQDVKDAEDLVKESELEVRDAKKWRDDRKLRLAEAIIRLHKAKEEAAKK